MMSLNVAIKFLAEVMINVEKIREYLKVWDPFKPLWEIDKAKFIVRFAASNPSAIVYDSNIQR